MSFYLYVQLFFVDHMIADTSHCFLNHSAVHNLTGMKPKFLTFGVGVEKIIIRIILSNFQSPQTIERKYLRHWIQVFSTTKQVKESNAIVMNNGEKIGLMLVIH